MPPSFALVYFIKDRVFDIVHISYISKLCLLPNSEFKKDKIYNVGWAANPADRTRPKSKNLLTEAGHTRPTCPRYPAFVIKVAESEPELQDVLDSGRRIRIPNVTTLSTEPMTDATDAEFDPVVEHQRRLLTAAKKLKLDKAAASTKRLTDILSSNKNMPICPLSDDSSDEEATGTRTLKHTSAAEVQKRPNRGMTRNLEEELKEVKQENKKLRKLNIKLQSRLIDKTEEKLQCDHCCPTPCHSKLHQSPLQQTKQIPTMSSGVITPASSATGNSEQSDSTASRSLTEKYSVKPQELDMLDRKRKPSLFTKNLLVRFVGSDKLRQSSLDGKTPNRGNNAARQALDTEAVNAIKELVRQRYSEAEVSKVNRFIIEKIADLRKNIAHETES